jgi:hypothetical protein
MVPPSVMVIIYNGCSRFRNPRSVTKISSLAKLNAVCNRVGAENPGTLLVKFSMTEEAS